MNKFLHLLTVQVLTTKTNLTIAVFFIKIIQKVLIRTREILIAKSGDAPLFYFKD
jgi:hypothetical protein